MKMDNSGVFRLQQGAEMKTNVEANDTLTLEQSASQTGKLLNCKNSSGTSVASIAVDGSISTSGSSTIDGQLDIVGQSDQVQLTIQAGATSQSAHVLQVEDHSGSVQAFINQDGGTSVGTLSSAALNVSNESDVVALSVTGNATQGSNLVEILTNSGTKLLTLSNGGSLDLVGDAQITGSVASNNTLIVKQAASQTASALVVQSNNGTNVFAVDPNGQASFVQLDITITSPATTGTANSTSGIITFSGFTTASGGTPSPDIVITNSSCKATSRVILTLAGFPGTSGIPVPSFTSASAGSFKMNWVNADSAKAISGDFAVHYLVIDKAS